MKYCSNCGGKRQGDTATCGYCGAEFEMLQTHYAPQTPQEKPNQQPAQQPLTQPPQYPNQGSQYPGQPPQYPNQGSQYPNQPSQYPNQPYQYPNQVQQHYYQPPLENQKYKSMGGWLLFCVIAMLFSVISDPIISIGNITDDLALLEEIRLSPMIFPEGMETAAWISFAAELGGLLTIVFTILYLVNIFGRKPNFLRYYQLVVIVSILYTVFALMIPSIILGYEYEIYGALSFHISAIVGGIIAFFLWTLYYCKSIRVRTYMGSDEYMEKAIFAYKNQPPLQ